MGFFILLGLGLAYFLAGAMTYRRACSDPDSRWAKLRDPRLAEEIRKAKLELLKQLADEEKSDDE